MKQNIADLNSYPQTGFVFCSLAVLIWSFSSILARFGGTSMGPWQFTGVVCILSGCLHLLFRWLMYGDFRNAIFLPPKLWIITIFGFAVCVLTFPLAMAISRTEGEICAVALINYLWPTMTVLLGVMLVPDTHFNKRLAMAVVLAFLGLILANIRQMPLIFAGKAETSIPLWRAILPYLLGLTAAMSWAFYSVFLARWRDWVKNYTSCAMGMLIAGAAALVVAVLTESRANHLSARGIVFIVLYALGPSAAGYLLWELAVPRTNVKTLGLMGALIPVLSIIWLCIFLRYLPGWELFAGAILVSLGIILSRRS
jgi:drug/metabolite transporter (DMT)-like permease